MEEILKVVFTLIVVFPFFMGAGYLILRKLLYICGPNEVLVFSGRPSQIGNRTVGYRIVKGGRGWRTPLIEQVNKVDLSNQSVLRITVWKFAVSGYGNLIHFSALF